MIDIGVGRSSRNVVLMNEVDINKTGLNKGDTGAMSGQILMTSSIKQENFMMYYPESNILVPLQFVPQPKTPSFNSIEVFLEKQL
jgi:hypothetical protein